MEDENIEVTEEVEISCDWYDVPCQADWLSQSVSSWFDELYEKFMLNFAKFVDTIPLPDFLVDLEPLVLPPEISYFVEPFQVEYGIGIIVSAYIARFILRRIPIIG